MKFNNKALLHKAGIVIRAQGERTEDLCRCLAEDQVGETNVVVIHEEPFAKAVRRSFEVGIELDAKWTFCLDADVLMDKQAIELCITELDELLPRTFKAQPRLLCKFHGAKLAAGFHIYRTRLLEKAIKYIPSNSESLRPETYVLRNMIKEGYTIAHLDILAGVHEYELFYRDIYRRMRLRGSKSGQIETDYLLTRIRHLHKSDPDYLIAERALMDSKQRPINRHSTDSIDEKEIEDVLYKLGLEEKLPLLESCNYLIVEKAKAEFTPDSKALAFTNQFLEKNFPYPNVKVLFIGSASIGPLYISTILKREGHTVYRIYQGYEKCLGERATPFLPPITKEKLLALKPDVVGFSIDISTFDDAVEMAFKIKEILPNTYIIFGGPHPTICPEETIKKASIDAICVGEGEFAMVELCHSLQMGKVPIGVKNLWVKHDGKIYRNPQRPYLQDLDSIPMDRDGIFYGGVYSGRGCVGRCAFCNIPTLRKNGPGGKYFRKRNVESVLDEVEIVYKQLREQSKKSIKEKLKWIIKVVKSKRKTLKSIEKGIPPIRFKDDTFLADKKWFLKFAPLFHKRFPKLTYICQARPNEIDEEVVYWLKKSGCVRISMGFETGSEKLRNDVLHKNVTNNQIATACKLLREQRIEIMGQWMYGLPGEMLLDTVRTFIMSVREGDFSQLHFTTPLPATELFDIAVAQGLISPDYHSKGLYNSELIFHNDDERLQILLISLIHVLKDVRIPENYKYIRYLGSKGDWRGRTIGEVFAEELESWLEKMENKK